MNRPAHLKLHLFVYKIHLEIGPIFLLLLIRVLIEMIIVTMVGACYE